LALPLNVAFVWHMHQPYYKCNLTEAYTLPWVRLHATKDYLHMAEVLAEHPRIHQTFNFVPSLVEQLRDYAAGRAPDRCLVVSRKEQLTDDDKAFILSFFFSINWDRFVRRYPRYWQLLRVRGELGGDVGLLSDVYWRDLIAWFNLVWIDPSYLLRDAELSALVEKGRGFSRADIDLILEKHRRICAAVLPLYKELADAGQVELTTSPYYHPILPLLDDTRSARVASPGLPLPSTLSAYPEDAREQIRQAAELHVEVFGRPPRGVWPPEGAVSGPAIGLLSSRNLFPNGGGFQWVATDEGILARSLGTSFPRDGYGSLLDPRPLYQPYRWVMADRRQVMGDRGRGEDQPPNPNTQHLTPALVFRDQVLSDRIGFVYKHWAPKDAAADLVGRLDAMADKLADDPEHYLAPIILDGENCWEEYANNGHDFLHALYSRIESDPKLRAVTVSEHLDAHPPRRALTRIHAGSWIASNLETWIGEPAQNRAWEYLALARSRLTAWQREAGIEDVRTLEAAWKELYIAEGSDWFWWYYSRNSLGEVQPFDADFRAHLANIYWIMGLPSPAWLSRPIVSPPPERARSISAYVSPRLAADEPAPPEWAGAGYVEPEVSTGAMQRAATLLRRLYFGYNPAELCLRVEANADLGSHAVAVYFASERGERGNAHVRWGAEDPQVESHGLSLDWEVAVAPGASSATISRAAGNDLWETVRSRQAVAAGQRVLELRVPLADLGLELGDTVSLVVAVARGGVLVETLPTSGAVSFTLAEGLGAGG